MHRINQAIVSLSSPLSESSFFGIIAGVPTKPSASIRSSTGPSSKHKSRSCALVYPHSEPSLVDGFQAFWEARPAERMRRQGRSIIISQVGTATSISLLRMKSIIRHDRRRIVMWNWWIWMGNMFIDRVDFMCKFIFLFNYRANS